MRYSQASRCGTPSLLTVLTLKSDPGNKPGSAQTVQPQVSTDYLLLKKKLSHYTVQIQCLQLAPGRRVTETSHLSTLNVGPGPGIEPRPPAWQAASLDAQPSAISFKQVSRM
jgi:hypothetical protein